MNIDLDAIKEKILITQFARDYLGCRIIKNNTMLCHLHNEKTPSMHLYDDKCKYYCFGCHKGGDVFSLIQEIKGVSFLEAAKIAAEYAGIKLEYTLGFVKESEQIKEKKLLLYKIMEDICLFFEKELINSEHLKYLYSRHLTDCSICDFRLGYCPKNINLIINQLKLKYSSNINLLLDTGIFRKGRSGFYCLLENRIIFPILDKFNQIVAFGGRALSDNIKPKYINASDSLIFKKSDVMYGENFAVQAARKQNEMFFVEGYLDVMIMHQIGLKNTVAALGTAIHESQIRKLFNYVEKITFAMDGDVAGYNSMISTIKKALPILTAGKFLCFAKLPKEHDPASLAIENKAVLLEHLEKAEFIAEMILKIVIVKYKKIDAADVVAALKREINSYLLLITDEILKKEYEVFFTQKLATLTQQYSFVENKYKKKQNYNKNYNLQDFFSTYDEILCYAVLILRESNLKVNEELEFLYKKSTYRQELKTLLGCKLAFDYNTLLALDIKSEYLIRKICSVHSILEGLKIRFTNLELWDACVISRIKLLRIKEKRRSIEQAFNVNSMETLQAILSEERMLSEIVNNVLGCKL